MKYFLHDTSSFDDEKITELYINFGYEGLGLFYTILEKLAKQEKPVKTSVLKSQLGVGKRLEKCWSFMEQIGIISSNNGETFNKQLLNFSEKYQIKKQKNNDRISEWREKQKDTENVTRYERVSNTPKVKLSKVKESKVSICTQTDKMVYRKFGHLSISISEYESVLEMGYLPGEVNDMLDQIQNYKKNKNYTSLYLTLKNWLKREKEKSSAKKEKGSLTDHYLSVGNQLGFNNTIDHE